MPWAAIDLQAEKLVCIIVPLVGGEGQEVPIENINDCADPGKYVGGVVWLALLDLRRCNTHLLLESDEPRFSPHIGIGLNAHHQPANV